MMTWIGVGNVKGLLVGARNAKQWTYEGAASFAAGVVGSPIAILRQGDPHGFARRHCVAYHDGIPQRFFDDLQRAVSIAKGADQNLNRYEQQRQTMQTL